MKFNNKTELPALAKINGNNDKTFPANLQTRSFLKNQFVHRMMLLQIIVFLFTCTNIAQEPTTSKAFALGFQLNEYQNDFGIGLSATSPYFANNKVAIRLRGNLMWTEHLKDEKITWSPYGNVTLGAVVVAGHFAGFIKAYAEGGFVGLFPSSEFSSESFVFGGYGLFGFEFYPGKRSCYFIEAGGIGTAATADKMPTSPIYSNGFIISTGLRIHIK